MLVGFGRGEADAAVAHHHGGDAVGCRRFEVAVPRRLTVVVRVDVDETRGDQQPARIDLASAGSDVGVGSDSGDHLTVDRDAVVRAGFGTGAVDDESVPDDQVMHGVSLAPTHPSTGVRHRMAPNGATITSIGPGRSRLAYGRVMDIRQEIIDTTTDDGEMAVLVTQPAVDPDGGGAWPTVLLFIDAPGIRSATREFAAKLAAEGYLVVTPDLHHREGRLLNALDTSPPDGKTTQEMVWGWIAAMTDDRIQHDADRALAAAGVADDTPIVTIGFCLGRGPCSGE